MRPIFPALLIPFLSCAAATAAEPRNVADIRSARSFVAEGAEIIRLQTAGKVNAVYARAMKDNAREQLRSVDESAGSEDPQLHRMIQESLAALDRDDDAALRGLAEQLFAMAGPRGPTD